MRRNRVSENMRALVRENTLEARNLILPLFVEENLSERTPIKSMPGMFRETETMAIAARSTITAMSSTTPPSKISANRR
jgi:porphobilinogen synthase